MGILPVHSLSIASTARKASILRLAHIGHTDARPLGRVVSAVDQFSFGCYSEVLRTLVIPPPRVMNMLNSCIAVTS